MLPTCRELPGNGKLRLRKGINVYQMATRQREVPHKRNQYILSVTNVLVQYTLTRKLTQLIETNFLPFDFEEAGQAQIKP